MKVKTKIICSVVLTILGAFIACVAGFIAQEHTIGDMPALVSILGVIGLISFLCGIACFVLIILFEDETK